jgi:hypothetical protein
VSEFYPTTYDFDGNPMPNTKILTMKPDVTYTLYGWPEDTNPTPQCALRSYTVHVP